MNIMDKTEIAWAAGFFDGDGNVAIFRNLSCPSSKSPIYSLMVTIVNTKEEVLSYFKDNFGGSLNPIKKRPWIYVWVVTGKKAGEFLNAIYLYSKLKTKEIEIANKFLSISTQCGTVVPKERTLLREQCLQEIKNLHYPGKGRKQVRQFDFDNNTYIL